MESKKIDVTVIICTRNRASQLASVLDSACKLVVPPGLTWEFVVVDNGSTDGTADVVARYADRLPIRCVREDTPGLSNARNRGVDEAKGDYICWTDDDVVIDSGWLAAYAAAFKRHPEAAVFGGKVIPFLEKPTPDWFEAAKYEWPFCSLLAYRDLGEEVVALTFKHGKTPYGANFAIRTAEQKRHPYNPQLGVSPQHKRVGEETEVIYHIFKDGANGWWVPDAKVTHIIPPKRQTLRYIYDYSFLTGETMAYFRDKHPNDNYLLATDNPPSEYHLSKLRLYRRAVNRLMRLTIALLTFNNKSKIILLSELGYLIGAASYRNTD